MDANLVGTQVSSAIVAVWGIQQLKKAPWFPLLKMNGQLWAKRTLSVLTALGVHTGISHVWNAGTAPGVAHVLIINIPPIGVIVEGLWHWSNQYIYQESAYQLFYARPPAEAPKA